MLLPVLKLMSPPTVILFTIQDFAHMRRHYSVLFVITSNYEVTSTTGCGVRNTSNVRGYGMIFLMFDVKFLTSLSVNFPLTLSRTLFKVLVVHFSLSITYNLQVMFPSQFSLLAFSCIQFINNIEIVRQHIFISFQLFSQRYQLYSYSEFRA